MRRLLLLILIFALASCARPPKRAPEYGRYHKKIPGWLKPYTVNGKTYYPLPSAKGYREVCIASWYGFNFHGGRTASGEIYNMHAFTAAHKILPIGSYVLVRNLENGREVVVRINDRGPFVKNRCIDLSYAAAKALGMIGKGTAKVEIIALSEGKIVKGGIVYKNIPNIKFGKFYLQVGAFTNYENALKLKNRLQKEFKNIKIEPFKKNGVTFYRVQIYLARDFNKASRMAEKLKRKRFKSAFLVAK